MLVFDPRSRVKAGDSLAHEYLSPYHDPSDEPVAEEKFDWSFNDADLPVDTWKIMMCVPALIMQEHNVNGTATNYHHTGTPKSSTTTTSTRKEVGCRTTRTAGISQGRKARESRYPPAYSIIICVRVGGSPPKIVSSGQGVEVHTPAPTLIIRIIQFIS